MDLFQRVYILDCVGRKHVFAIAIHIWKAGFQNALSPFLQKD